MLKTDRRDVAAYEQIVSKDEQPNKEKQSWTRFGIMTFALLGGVFALVSVIRGANHGIRSSSNPTLLLAKLINPIAPNPPSATSVPETPNPPESDYTPPVMGVWYGPQVVAQHSKGPDPHLFPELTTPEASWPELARRTSYLKLRMGILHPTASTDAQLQQLILTLKEHGIKTALAIGGARWGAGQCDAETVLKYAKQEQNQVARWTNLGGTIDSVTTDHGITWDIRHDLKREPCEPPVPVTVRVDALAQSLASWRTFLGPKTSMGFIEALGYWTIDGPDGTEFTTTSPKGLLNITGWIPRLDDVTDLLLEKCDKYNPMPSRPLIDHYQMDFEMDGVEHDTTKYGHAPPVGMNYGRVLGAEILMKARNITTGIILGAKAANPTNIHCVVACDPSYTENESASLKTLNYTRGYMQIPTRGSAYGLFSQWQPYPNVTGPETVQYSQMWMASQGAEIVMPKVLRDVK